MLETNNPIKIVILSRTAYTDRTICMAAIERTDQAVNFHSQFAKFSFPALLVETIGDDLKHGNTLKVKALYWEPSDPLKPVYDVVEVLAS